MARQIVLMDKARIERSLKRMVIQIEEALALEKQLIVIGLNERGYTIAQQVVHYLQESLGNNMVELCRLDFNTTAANAPLPNCTEKNVIIIDDVIFSGKTMFDALTAVCATGDPAKIELLALVDRGHRRYPVAAAILGIKVPTKLGEHIEVMLASGKLEQVILFKN